MTASHFITQSAGFTPNNLLDVIRVMTAHSPLYERGGRGDLSFARVKKSPSIPLFQRGRWVEFFNGLFRFITNVSEVRS